MDKDTYYKELREQKIAAGLRPEQADEVVKRQRAEDEANEPKKPEVKKPEADKTKGNKKPEKDKK